MSLSWPSQRKTPKRHAYLARTALLLTFGLSASAEAGQPIFSEMPRWSNGWGVQVIPEYRQTTLDGTNVEPQQYASALVNIDGVYTWKRWIRATLKVPVFVNPSSLSKGILSNLDSVTLALPLKKYFNLDGRTGSWTFAPQLKTPSQHPQGTNLYAKHGWNLSYDTETYRYHYGVYATVWGTFENLKAEGELEAFIGMNVHGFNSSGHIKFHATVFAKEALKLTGYRTGPTFYWRLTDTWHTQMQWRYLRHTKPNGDTRSETRTQLGIAVVF